MFYRRRNMQTALAVAPASGMVAPAWTPTPAPYNADYNNGFAQQSPLPYQQQDQWNQQGQWNGYTPNAQPMQQAEFLPQQPFSEPGNSNEQTMIDYSTIQAPEIMPPVAADESVSDPLLKAIMHQAQAGLFFLEGNEA